MPAPGPDRQRLGGRRDRDRPDRLGPGAELRRRDAHQLDPLAPPQLRELAEGVDEQVARGRDDRQPVGLRVRRAARSQHPVLVSSGLHDELPGAVLGPQVRDPGHEPVAAFRGEDDPVLRPADQHRPPLGAVRSVQPAREGLPLAAGGGQDVGGKGVRAPRPVQEHGRIVAAAGRGGEEFVSRPVAQRLRVDLVALGGPHPAAPREHHRDRLRGHQLVAAEGPRGRGLHDAGAALVAVRLRVGEDLVPDEGVEPGRGAKALRERVPLLAQRLLLGADIHLLEPCEMAELQLQDRFRLDVGEPEPLHQHRLGPVLLADDRDHLVQVEEGGEDAFQPMEADLDPLPPELEPPPHGPAAELDPFDEQGAEVPDAGPAVEPDEVEVDPARALEVRGREEVGHQPFGVDPVRPEAQHEAHRVRLVRLVAEVLDHGELALRHLGGDLVHDPRGRHLVGQRGHDHGRRGPPLVLEGRADADRARPGAVDGPQVLGRRDDLRAGRKVGAAHVLAEVVGGRVRVLEEPHAGRRRLAQVVGRDVRGHADRDAGGPVQEHGREAGGEQLRLLQGPVEVGPELDRPLPQLLQEHPRERRQPRLGVAHRREGAGVVRRAPVALPVDQGVADGERLRHQDHRLVAGGVPVRVELPEDVPHRARRLLETGPVRGVGPPAGGGLGVAAHGRAQAQLRHRVHDPALHRLQPVGDVRQRPVEDDVHGVVEVRLVGELAHRPFVGLRLQALHQVGRHVPLAPPGPALRRPRRRLPPRARRGGPPPASSRAGGRARGRCRRRAPRSAARGGGSPATWWSRGAAPGSSRRAP